jgi:hypothetical protein
MRFAVRKKWPALMLPRPCTGALGANSPLEAHHGRIRRGAGPPQAALSAGGDWLLPEDGPEPTEPDDPRWVDRASQTRRNGTGAAAPEEAGGGGEQLAKIVRGETFHRRNFRVGIGRGCRPFRGMRLRKKRFDAEMDNPHLLIYLKRYGRRPQVEPPRLRHRTRRYVPNLDSRRGETWQTCLQAARSGDSLRHVTLSLKAHYLFQFIHFFKHSFHR